MSIFDTFERKHDYLVCVDSDGCVMDTMNCKHFNCFGPCMVTEWGLEAWKDEILERWNVINMIGQPPTTAEYIQSSSRVGRKHDGLVVSLYNPLKNRELSYYENYIAYHKVFYKYVEPLSVTTFTEMTLQRLLSNLFVSYMLLIKQRNRLRDITPNDVDCFKDFLSSRSKSINVESHKVFEPNMSGMVDRIYYACFDVVHNPSLYRQRNEYIRSYIISNDYKGKKEFPLMGSLRDVESDTILIYE